MIEEKDPDRPSSDNFVSSDWMATSANSKTDGTLPHHKIEAAEAISAEMQSAKMEALGRLSAGIAHEINTPAQFVGDHLKFIEDSIKEILSGPASVYLPDFVKENLPVAIKNAIVGVNRIGGIVATMRRYSHKGLDRKMELGDVNQAIRDALVLSKAKLDPGLVDLRFSLDKDMPKVKCALSEVSHAILSLVVNAYDSIVEHPPGGEKGVISIRSTTARNGVKVEIRDNGGGVPVCIRDRIFEPFFTTKAVGQGMGQGLALAHALIVGEHGGSLTFRPAEGGGATFVLFLPLDGNPSEA